MADFKTLNVNGTTYSVKDETARTSAANVASSLADEYDSTSTYSVGDYVMYGDKLYECSTAVSTAEEWDSSKWSAVLVTDIPSGGTWTYNSSTETLTYS